LPDEADMLWHICNEPGGYPNYEELRSDSAALAAEFDHVDFDPERGIASNDQPIGVTAIRGATNGGAVGYLQGSEHAHELIAQRTSAKLKRLVAHYPGILDRSGYEKLLICDHIDPVGESMQEGGSQPSAGTAEYALNGWRGSWSAYDQISWAYPTASGQLVRPEIALSLELLQEARDFFGSLHGSVFSSYVLVSRQDEALIADLQHILSNSGLDLNLDLPEAANTLVHAPGVFDIVNKAHVDESVYAPDIPQEISAKGGGTNALDHIAKGALMVVPEVASIESAAGNEPSGFTRRHAVEMRANMTQAAAASIDQALGQLNPWLTDNMIQPRVQRLYNAAAWYREVSAELVQGHLKIIETEASTGKADVLLSKAKYAQILGLFATEALMYVGNARRLARQAGNVALQQELTRHIRRGAEIIGPTRVVPLSQQVAIQSLLALASMRHATSATA